MEEKPKDIIEMKVERTEEGEIRYTRDQMPRVRLSGPLFLMQVVGVAVGVAIFIGLIFFFVYVFVPLVIILILWEFLRRIFSRR